MFSKWFLSLKLLHKNICSSKILVFGLEATHWNLDRTTAVITLGV
jgi:hypothetical protein